MATIDVEISAHVPTNTNLQVGIYEDVGDTGSINNSAFTTVNDGTNTYSLSGFDKSSGNRFYTQPEYELSAVTQRVKVNYIEIMTVEPPSTPQNVTVSQI